MAKSLCVCALALLAVLLCFQQASAFKASTQLKTANEILPYPIVGVRSTGVACLSMNETDGEIKIVLRDIVDLWKVHIHNANKTSNGPLLAAIAPIIAGKAAGEITYEPPFSIRGQFTLVRTFKSGDLGKTNAELAALIQNDEAYVNIHTIKYKDGELRGQLRCKTAADCVF